MKPHSSTDATMTSKPQFKLRSPHVPYRIGVDIDGVLANFNKGCAIKLFGKVPEGWDWAKDPNQWNWPNSWGASDEDVNKFWSDASQERTTVDSLWYNLEVLAPLEDIVRLRSYAIDHDVYYISHRPPAVKRETELWMVKHIVQNPSVMLSDKKGHIAHALELHTVIDDKPENLMQILNWCGIECVPFLLDKPWNRNFHHQYVIRVGSITEALDTFESIVRQ